MKSKEAIVELAIKRHDIDAGLFQNAYESHLDSHGSVFLYGRSLILDELDALLSTLPKGAKILDVGCGTGHLAKSLQDKGYDVTAIEPSEVMLDHAKRNFPKVQFDKGVASDLPYSDNTFDLVVAIEVLRYLNKESNIEAYNEFKRVLKPGGYTFVTQVNKYASDFYYPFFYMKGILFNLRGTIYHHCEFTTPRKEERLLTKLGFANITTIGRLASTTRIADKFGKLALRAHIWLVESLFGKQRFLSNPFKAMAGHLLVIAQK